MQAPCFAPFVPFLRLLFLLRVETRRDGDSAGAGAGFESRPTAPTSYQATAARPCREQNGGTRTRTSPRPSQPAKDPVRYWATRQGEFKIPLENTT
jgi:hypothetical protein